MSTTKLYSYPLCTCAIVWDRYIYNVISLKINQDVAINRTLQKNYFRAEMKLLCFFFYFSFAAIFSFTFLVIVFQNIFRDQQLLFEYYSCEAFGTDPSDPCVLQVDRRRDQTLIMLSNLMLIFAPYVTLIYIVPVNKVRKWKLLSWCLFE